MKPVFILIFCLSINFTLTSFAQQQTFDIATFTAPSGWTKQLTENAVQLSIEDKAASTYCIIILSKSIPASNNYKDNFTVSWESLVKEMALKTTEPSMQPSVNENGWEALSGYAPFDKEGTSGVVLLVTMSGFEKMVNIIILFSSEDYQKEIEAFLSSVEMKRITTSQNQAATNPQPKNSNGIVKSTTTFSDGWTAKAMDEYVLVTKENVKFYIHYGTPIPESERGLDESITTKLYWDKLIGPRYTITNLWLNPDVGMMTSFNYYAEGTGIENSTGKQVYIGFRIIKESGVSFCSEAIAPNKEEYLKHFSSLSMLKDLRNSNRFAVSKEDLPGEWSSSSSSMLEYYNVYTGASAGMTFTSGGQDFSFKSNGLYNARISGNMGNMGGSQVAFDKKYNGAFSNTEWEITLTNYSDETTVFTCHYEAVKGGRILHIAKKLAPGVRYSLVKVK